MEAPPQDRKRKRNNSAPDEEPQETTEMCVCDCGVYVHARYMVALGFGQEEEPDDVDLRCCCTQCGPVDVNSQTQRCTIQLTRAGAQIDRFLRLGSQWKALFRSGDWQIEPFFCEDCRGANHERLRVLEVKAAVIRARQERLSQAQLRGSESASASSRNVQTQ
jgi:hypothetical protein